MEADRFFYDKYRYYEFRHDLLKEAHAWCLGTLANTIFVDRPDKVVVSNTFITKWEMQPYLDMAKRWGVTPQIVECHGNFGNVHNVPKETISQMKARWEPYPFKE